MSSQTRRQRRALGYISDEFVLAHHLRWQIFYPYSVSAEQRKIHQSGMKSIIDSFILIAGANTYPLVGWNVLLFLWSWRLTALVYLTVYPCDEIGSCRPSDYQNLEWVLVIGSKCKAEVVVQTSVRRGKKNPASRAWPTRIKYGHQLEDCKCDSVVKILISTLPQLNYWQ